MQDIYFGHWSESKCWLTENNTIYDSNVDKLYDFLYFDANKAALLELHPFFMAMTVCSASQLSQK